MSPLLTAILSGLSAMFVWLAVFGLVRRRMFRGCRLPFTKKYLRPAGESLRRRLDVLLDRFDSEILLVAAASFLFALGVFAYASGEKPVGRLFGLLGAGGLVLLFLRFKRLAGEIANHRLGYLGERAVGEELNRLQSDGWTIFHDVPFAENPGAGPFNVDHVVVGRGGLYAIETKARRKRRAKDGHEAVFDGRLVQFPWGGDFLGPDNARFRAKALASWLSKALGRDIPVTPVLVLPGWFVRRTGASDLRVVGGGELHGVFRGENERPQFDEATVRAIAALLDERCRDVVLD
jgi:hypothetical protein